MDYTEIEGTNYRIWDGHPITKAEWFFLGFAVATALAVIIG